MGFFPGIWFWLDLVFCYVSLLMVWVGLWDCFVLSYSDPGGVFWPFWFGCFLLFFPLASDAGAGTLLLVRLICLDSSCLVGFFEWSVGLWSVVSAFCSFCCSPLSWLRVGGTGAAFFLNYFWFPLEFYWLWISLVLVFWWNIFYLFWAWQDLLVVDLQFYWNLLFWRWFLCFRCLRDEGTAAAFVSISSCYILGGLVWFLLAFYFGWCWWLS